MEDNRPIDTPLNFNPADYEEVCELYGPPTDFYPDDPELEDGELDFSDCEITEEDLIILDDIIAGEDSSGDTTERKGLEKKNPLFVVQMAEKR